MANFLNVLFMIIPQLPPYYIPIKPQVSCCILTYKMEPLQPTPTTPISQLYVRVLVVMTVVVSTGFTWLVVTAGRLHPSTVALVGQTLTILTIISLLMMVIRRFRRTRHGLQSARQIAEAEAALLRKRSAFIYNSSSKLSDKLAEFEAGIAGLDPGDRNVGPLNKKTAELRSMLDRLDTISKLEANMALTSTTRLNAMKLLDEAAAGYQAVFTAKGAKLHVSIPGDVLVDGDENMLKEVFTAIIDNAAKFMPTQAGLLDIVASKRHRKLYITFTDNGPGISADKLPQLFQPFSRVDGVMTFDRQGQGLSLYISRLCIEIMGGHIDLTSEVGMGTTVVIELPLAKKRSNKLAK